MLRDRKLLMTLSAIAIGASRILPGDIVSDAKAQSSSAALAAACQAIDTIDDVEQLTRIAECINSDDASADWCTAGCSLAALQRIVDVSAPAAGPGPTGGPPGGPQNNPVS